MKVLKFGGTSVGNAQAMQNTLAIIQTAAVTNPVIIVVSAMSGVTDKLLTAANAAVNGDYHYKTLLSEIEQTYIQAIRNLIPLQAQSSLLSAIKKTCNEAEDICNGIYKLNELSAKTKDKLVCVGELMSSHIIAAALQSSNITCEWKDSRELIVTNSQHSNAKVNFEKTNENILNWLQQQNNNVFVLPGFIAADMQGATTTLGRGGSDYTASIIGAAVNATAIEIWTDVSGMMTADPRLVKDVKIINEISYEEAMELSHFGAKVIYPPTIQPALSKKIPVWIKNSFDATAKGTIIHQTHKNNNEKISGISSINQISLLNLEGSGMIGVPGFSKRLFEYLSSQGINVILITQSSSEQSICVGIASSQVNNAVQAINHGFEEEIRLQKVNAVVAENNLSIIALVGDNMKSHPGISGKMFGALGRNGINIRAIAQGSTERNISAVITSKDVKKAVNILHETFFETEYTQINVFLTGAGNVGSKLLQQIKQQQQLLQEKLKLQINITGIANSKQFIIQEEGIDLNNWQPLLQEAPAGNINDYTAAIIQKNLRNSIFADVTASDIVAGIYPALLQKSISVVACNKIAAANTYGYYKQLKNLAAEHNVNFLFETNVGAGLPIIATLQDLINSGDRVHKIQAVLSGTLNFVFNEYKGEVSFSSVVKQAQTEGYTEPDPRLDLSGTDVMRKIMILAREAGNVIEMNDIENNTFLPASCLEGDVAAFYAAMEKEETHFKAIYQKAKEVNCKLKYVASFENGKASVGLQHIDESHNLYHLYGKDNIVLFYTDRYSAQPLVIKGAGAGADVTASGVFADIMRAAKKSFA